MDGDTLSQNSGDHSKCYAFSHVTVASHQALQAVAPHVRSRAGVRGGEVGTMPWRALREVTAGRSWEPLCFRDSYSSSFSHRLVGGGLS